MTVPERPAVASLSPHRGATASLNEDGYRGWMRRFGVARLEKRFNPFDEDDSQHFQLTAVLHDGREFHASAYEHGPHDPCANPKACGGGMAGWSDVDGALQVMGFKIEAAAVAPQQEGTN